jgi:beta-phosphoglucomutase-like phosphatase (HAD superfamily)
VIEDAPAGIKAAKAAGMYAVGITNSVKSDALNEADLVVHSYQEIRELLIASE